MDDAVPGLVTSARLDPRVTTSPFYLWNALRATAVVKTLHLYLVRQVMGALIMTVAVFTLVLLLGNVLREILALLVNRQATLLVVGKAIALLIPYVMLFALPMGLLTATLLVFGRFSADQEFTAARASGVSLLSLVTPVLILSAILSVVSGWFSLSVAPRCRFAYKTLLYEQGLERPAGVLPENQMVKDFPGLNIYVGREEGVVLRNVIIWQLGTNAPTPGVASPNTAPVVKTLSADLAFLVQNPTNHLAFLHFPQAEVFDNASYSATFLSDFEYPLPSRAPPPSRQELKLSEMTFKQLMSEYYEYRRRGIDPMPVAVQLHRQVAFSFSCIGFTLVGIPLGLRAHRRETSAGVFIALVLVFVYYTFIILNQA